MQKVTLVLTLISGEQWGKLARTQINANNKLWRWWQRWLWVFNFYFQFRNMLQSRTGGFVGQWVCGWDCNWILSEAIKLTSSQTNHFTTTTITTTTTSSRSSTTIKLTSSQTNHQFHRLQNKDCHLATLVKFSFLLFESKRVFGKIWFLTNKAES